MSQLSLLHRVGSQPRCASCMLTSAARAPARSLGRSATPATPRLQKRYPVSGFLRGRLSRALFERSEATRSSSELCGLPPLTSCRSGQNDCQTPRQLPPEAPNFVGRLPELAQLQALVPSKRSSSRSGLAVIVGGPGVGKTALALRWAHQVKDRFPDGQIYIDLRGFGPNPTLTATDALASMLRALGIESTNVPPDEAASSAMYRSVTADRRILLLLDNAADEAQIRPLLPGSSACAVLITSRRVLSGLVVKEGAAIVSLDVLSHDEAWRRFRSEGRGGASQGRAGRNGRDHSSLRCPAAGNCDRRRACGHPSGSAVALRRDSSSGVGWEAVRVVQSGLGR